jgi:hypothetical protein
MIKRLRRIQARSAKKKEVMAQDRDMFGKAFGRFIAWDAVTKLVSLFE